MAEFYKDVRKEIKFSEVAVDGLFAGLLAGLVMAAYLGVTTLARSETLGDLFNHFNPTLVASPMIGFVMHLAVSSVYGILFGLVWYVAARTRRLALRAPQAVALGIGYGAGLFFLAWYVLLPASASPLLQLPTWQFGAAHLVYGAILGWSTQRSIR